MDIGKFQDKNVPLASYQILESPITPITKVMKNGQLLILRDGKTYNAQCIDVK